MLCPDFCGMICPNHEGKSPSANDGTPSAYEGKKSIGLWWQPFGLRGQKVHRLMMAKRNSFVQTPSGMDGSHTTSLVQMTLAGDVATLFQASPSQSPKILTLGNASASPSQSPSHWLELRWQAQFNRPWHRPSTGTASAKPKSIAHKFDDLNCYSKPKPIANDINWNCYGKPKSITYDIDWNCSSKPWSIAHKFDDWKCYSNPSQSPTNLTIGHHEHAFLVWTTSDGDVCGPSACDAKYYSHVPRRVLVYLDVFLRYIRKQIEKLSHDVFAKMIETCFINTFRLLLTQMQTRTGNNATTPTMPRRREILVAMRLVKLGFLRSLNSPNNRLL